MKLVKVRVRDKDLSAWMKAGFPAGFQLTFERKPKGASVKEKVVVQGRLSERSTELYIEYKESTNSRHWTFDSINYRKLYNEWSYGRGAEKRDSFSGSPKNALTKILQWQVVQNDWDDEVSNIKISFS